MNTKIFSLLFLMIAVSLGANAQLEGKTFKTTVENIGEINLKFKDKVYELSTSANVVVVKGNYEIKEKTIAFTDIEGPMACPKDVTGRYDFVFNNGELKLKAIEDACPGRNTMAATTWKEVNN